ncbi:hypothetical protein QJS83_14955 [Bdellovibrio sp. 22V]|uniref:hypothetical protein n=1 Tax=Bdellovibrio sp. 22V TaxID=3044166 RepID=UPI002542EE04|nr:hypothetical protein [Bdellovibrio sp. 22V]WII71762.1 hypothetical protein QJS83_14955 [Bdellovibrio sp. 22V]
MNRSTQIDNDVKYLAYAFISIIGTDKFTPEMSTALDRAAFETARMADICDFCNMETYATIFLSYIEQSQLFKPFIAGAVDEYSVCGVQFGAQRLVFRACNMQSNGVTIQ